MSDVIGVRGNIGKNITVLEAKEGKPLTVYTTLAESKYTYLGDDEAGKPQYKEEPPVWHDLALTGNAAKRFKDKFQSGDAIVVLGKQAEKKGVDDEGKPRTGTTLFVSAFGPDAERTKFSIQRDEPAADAEAGLSQQMNQQQTQTVDAGPAMQPTV